MKNNKVHKQIFVQPDKAALLSSEPMRYSPMNHALLKTDIATSVVFTQLEYLWFGRIGKQQAYEDTKVTLPKSYTRLRDSYFQWMSRRHLITIVKKLESVGAINIDRTKRRCNSYSVNVWKDDYKESVLKELAYDPERFIFVFPQLANLRIEGDKLGLVCAILLQLIHYISYSDGIAVVSQAKIHKYMFYCVSIKTIQRSIKKLVALQLIVAEYDSDALATAYCVDYKQVQYHFSTKSVTETKFEFNEDEPVAPEYAINAK